LLSGWWNFQSLVNFDRMMSQVAPKNWLMRAGVAGIVILCGYLGIRIFQLRHAEMAHALWWTGDIIVRYLEVNDGRWPRAWEDLATVVGEEDLRGRGVAECAGGRRAVEYRRKLPIRRLREMVWVDWRADVHELAMAERSAERPPFLVVRPLRGDHFYFSGAEPNEMIRAYLAARAGR
jgi:hypothetical protein